MKNIHINCKVSEKTSEILTINVYTQWCKLKLSCHYKIEKSTDYSYNPKVHIAIKY